MNPRVVAATVALVLLAGAAHAQQKGGGSLAALSNLGGHSMMLSALATLEPGIAAAQLLGDAELVVTEVRAVAEETRVLLRGMAGRDIPVQLPRKRVDAMKLETGSRLQSVARPYGAVLMHGGDVAAVALGDDARDLLHSSRSRGR